MLTFSPDPPTAPGWYTWRWRSFEMAVEVVLHRGELTALFGVPRAVADVPKWYPGCRWCPMRTEPVRDLPFC
jgi:hypothetical protein